MKLWRLSLILITCIVGVVNAQAGDVIESFETGSFNWSNGTMEAVGIGVAPEKYLGSSRARPLALRAARVDALRNLLEQTQGVKVETQTLTKDFAVESDLVRTTMTGAIRNAVQVGQPKYMEDGSVEITMAINYKKQIAPVVMRAHTQSLATASMGELNHQAMAMPETVDAKAQVITGIVIDAVGLGLRTALAPKILNESGEVIYDGNMVNEDKQADIVAYDTSATDAAKLARVGDTPITLKAVKVQDLTNVVISDADADKLMKKGGLHDVLRNAQIAFAL